MPGQPIGGSILVSWAQAGLARVLRERWSKSAAEDIAIAPVQA